MGGQGAREAGSKGLEKTEMGWVVGAGARRSKFCYQLFLVCDLGLLTAPLWASVSSPETRGKGLPHPRLYADLHGIPQLVGQIVRADAVREALRQEHRQETRERW